MFDNAVFVGRLSKTDPCSVQFGCETPKFCFEFAVDFGIFFAPRKKGPKQLQKTPPQNAPGNLFGNFPSDFCRSPFFRRTDRLSEFTRTLLPARSSNATSVCLLIVC